MELSPLYLERIQTATERGLERGLEREIALVVKQLRHRLGTIAPEIEERIRHLPIDRVEDLGMSLLDFEGETDLMRWLDGA